MAKRVRPAYSGVLIKPIEYKDWQQRVGLLAPKFQESQVYKEQVQERFIALLAHYNIPADSADLFQSLAVSLMFTHVPGFRIRPKATKKQQWNAKALRKLRLEVNKIRSRNERGELREKPLSASRACDLLAKRRGKSKGETQLTGPTVRRLYSEAKEQRRKHLSLRLARWEISPAFMGKPAQRRARLSHPYWKARLAAGDPEALRHYQMQLQKLPSGVMGGLFSLGAGWEEC